MICYLKQSLKLLLEEQVQPLSFVILTLSLPESIMETRNIAVTFIKVCRQNPVVSINLNLNLILCKSPTWDICAQGTVSGYYSPHCFLQSRKKSKWHVLIQVSKVDS